MARWATVRSMSPAVKGPAPSGVVVRAVASPPPPSQAPRTVTATASAALSRRNRRRLDSGRLSCSGIEDAGLERLVAGGALVGGEAQRHRQDRGVLRLHRQDPGDG